MFVLTLKWNKRTAVLVIAAAAALLIALVLFVGGSGRRAAAPATAARLDSTEKRVAYLASLGWSVDPASETEQQILIPKEFGPVYEKYNELQLRQGFDLREYRGMDATLYSYSVTNHPRGDGVLAQLIVFAGEAIGGDVHSCALDGFMHGLRPASD